MGKNNNKGNNKGNILNKISNAFKGSSASAPKEEKSNSSSTPVNTSEMKEARAKVSRASSFGSLLAARKDARKVKLNAIRQTKDQSGQGSGD
jgi:hypothetical protein